jgi:hypothetical protein
LRSEVFEGHMLCSMHHQLLVTGDSASVRLFFAKIEINECYSKQLSPGLPLDPVPGSRPSLATGDQAAPM